jgi:hypothetical protein
MAVAVRVPEGAVPQAVPEELELLLDEELELELLDEELELLLELELFDEELELLEELVEPVVEELELELELELLLDDELELLETPPPLIVPADATKVTRSSLAPSSRRLIRSV